MTELGEVDSPVVKRVRRASVVVAAFTLGVGVVAFGLAACSPPGPSSVDFLRSHTVWWCDGPDKVWALSRGSHVALAVVAAHPDCGGGGR